MNSKNIIKSTTIIGIRKDNSVVIAGDGAQWTQRWFNDEHVEKHFTMNG